MFQLPYYSHCCWPLIPSNNAVSKKDRMAAAALNHNLFYILYHMSAHLVIIYLPSSVKVPHNPTQSHPIPPHPTPSHPIRGVKQRGIIAAPGDVLVPNWFPGLPLRPFYDCISSLRLSFLFYKKNLKNWKHCCPFHSQNLDLWKWNWLRWQLFQSFLVWHQQGCQWY